MNSYYFTKRKNALLVLLFFFTAFIFSCSKKDEVEVDLGTAATGSYLITSISGSSAGAGTITIPAGANYTAIVTKVSNKVVSLVVNMGTTNFNFGNINLSGSEASINLDATDSSGKLTGNISNKNQMNFTVTSPSGGTPILVLTATK